MKGKKKSRTQRREQAIPAEGIEDFPPPPKPPAPTGKKPVPRYIPITPVLAQRLTALRHLEDGRCFPTVMEVFQIGWQLDEESGWEPVYQSGNGKHILWDDSFFCHQWSRLTDTEHDAFERLARSTDHAVFVTPLLAEHVSRQAREDLECHLMLGIMKGGRYRDSLKNAITKWEQDSPKWRLRPIETHSLIPQFARYLLYVVRNKHTAKYFLDYLAEKAPSLVEAVPKTSAPVHGNEKRRQYSRRLKATLGPLAEAFVARPEWKGKPTREQYEGFRSEREKIGPCTVGVDFPTSRTFKAWVG